MNECNQLCDKGRSHACHELMPVPVRHHKHRCSTGLMGAGSTTLPTVCTTAIPAPLIFFPKPQRPISSSRYMGQARLHCRAESGVSRLPAGTTLQRGLVAIQRAARSSMPSIIPGWP